MVKHIEAEGGELILKNNNGDVVIIPKDKRKEVTNAIKNNDNYLIDKIIEDLPIMESYAQDGSLIPYKVDDTTTGNVPDYLLKNDKREQVLNPVINKNLSKISKQNKPKINLDALELEPIDNIYQPSTLKTVVDNKIVFDLKPDTKIDIKIADKIFKEKKQPIDINSINSKNENEVKKLQEKLYNEGYDLGDYGEIDKETGNYKGNDGKFGKSTKQAIIDYNNDIKIYNNDVRIHNEKEENKSFMDLLHEQELKDKQKQKQKLLEKNKLEYEKDKLKYVEDFEISAMNNTDKKIYDDSGKLTPYGYSKQIGDLFEKYKSDKNDNLSFSYETPYKEVNGNKEPLNCIHGVCTFIEEANPGILKQMYTGNITWQDEYTKNDFVIADLEDYAETGFPNGTMLQYGDTRKDYIASEKWVGQDGNVHYGNKAAENFDNAFIWKDKEKGIKYTPEERAAKLKSVENDFIGGHDSMIVSNYMADDGERHYMVFNNQGEDVAETEDVPESELFKMLNDSEHLRDTRIYSMLRPYVYNPSQAEAVRKEGSEANAKMAGYNKNAGYYVDENKNAKLDFEGVKGINTETLKPDKWFDSSVNDSDSINEFVKIYEDNFKEIGKGADMPPKVLNRLLQDQIAILWKESQLGTDLLYQIKQGLSEETINTLRKVTGGNSTDNWMQDYWDKNAQNIQSDFATYEDFVADETKNIKESFAEASGKRSSGPYQQKYLSPRGKFHKYDITSNIDRGNALPLDALGLNSFMFNALESADGGGNKEDFALASTALAIDNYHELKRKHLNWSEEKLLDLTMLMHSSPGKANSERYVSYYYDERNKDINLLRQLTEARNKLTKKKSK